MLLSTYFGRRGLLPDLPAGSSFGVIRTFLFGEEYTVELRVGEHVASYRFDDLTDALKVLASEFRADDRMVPKIEIVDYAKTRDPSFGEIIPVGNEKRTLAVSTPSGKSEQFAQMMQGWNQVPTFGPAPQRVLAVTRWERNLHFPMPPIESYVEEIERAVTFFSLTGNWDQLDGRANL